MQRKDKRKNEKKTKSSVNLSNSNKESTSPNSISNNFNFNYNNSNIHFNQEVNSIDFNNYTNYFDYNTLEFEPYNHFDPFEFQKQEEEEGKIQTQSTCCDDEELFKVPCYRSNMEENQENENLYRANLLDETEEEFIKTNQEGKNQMILEKTHSSDSNYYSVNYSKSIDDINIFQLNDYNYLTYVVKNFKISTFLNKDFLENLNNESYSNFITLVHQIHYNNLFDICFFTIQTHVLRGSGTLENLLKSNFSNILHAKIWKNKKETSHALLRESNLRKQGKTFFNRNLILLVNSMFSILLDKEYSLTNMKFNDPHKKQNIKLIDKSILDIICYQNEINSIFKIIVDKISSGEFEIDVENPIKCLVLQLLFAILNSSYSDAFTKFNTSKLYENIGLKNIVKQVGKEFSSEFNFYFKTFIDYIKEDI